MKNSKKTNFLLSLSLIVMALIFGTDVSIALPAAVTDGAVADEKGINTDLTGTSASAGRAMDGGLVDPDIDNVIAKYRPYKVPLETDMRKLARKVSVNTREVKHYASSVPRLTVLLKTAITNSTAKLEEISITFDSADSQMFSRFGTIMFDVHGYDKNNNEAGKLICFITAKAGNTITIQSINGKKDSPESSSSYIPDIPADTSISVCANACSESQLLVNPENMQPKEHIAYTQKSICNIVMTDAFIRLSNQHKDTTNAKQRLKGDALYSFRRKNNKTLWVGVQAKINMNTGTDMGNENVYFSEGLLAQVQNLYAYDTSKPLSFADLIALAKMQFTDYSASDTAEVYCGKNFMEKLMNIDFTKHKDISFESKQEVGIDISAFKCTFGTLNFKYDPTLEDIGMADYAFVADMKNAVRYSYVDGKALSVDMKNGAGEVREAQRDVYIEDFCLCLKGYNSILIGPSTKVVNNSSLSGAYPVITVNSFDEVTNPLQKQVVYLATADGSHSADAFYEYSNTAWIPYVSE